MRESIVQLRRPVVEKLRPGLQPATVEASLGRLQVALPHELIHLYCWRDGTDVHEGSLLDDLHFFPGYYLMSLEHALTSFELFRNDPKWNHNWFPVFASGGGDFYAVICQEECGARSAPVVGFLLGEPDHEIEYENLTTMLSCLRVCFEQEIFFVTAEGFLEADSDRQFEVDRSVNPNLAGYVAERERELKTNGTRNRQR